MTEICPQTRTDTIKAIYKEYLDWETSYSTEVLVGLRRSYQGLPELPTIEVADTSSLEVSYDAFTFEDFADGTVSDIAVITLSVSHEGFGPHPRYESCAPANKNFLVGDDQESMQFVPYSDDPSFDFTKHDEEYTRYEWQCYCQDWDLRRMVYPLHYRFFRDPDLETLAAKLSNELGRSSDPKTRIRYERLVKVGRGSFDQPPGWTGRLPYEADHTHDAGPRTTLESLGRYFCNNPNCLTGYCIRHDISPPFIPVQPTISNSVLTNSAEKPCGNNCFVLRLFSRPIIHNGIWTDTDIELLEVLFENNPNALPCDLATICRKPCHEIFKRRADYVARFKDKKGPSAFDQGASESDSEDPPCGHQGSCTSASRCACVAKGVKCTLSCRCDSKKCERQRKGCNCRSTRARITPPCATRNCPCSEAGMECDPRLCLTCCARYPSDKTKCRNVALQQGWTKETEVLQTQYGLGLFLREDVVPGDLIIEYTGELIFEPTTISRDKLATHRGRCYLFDINPPTDQGRRKPGHSESDLILALDSSFYGNASRYINHSAEKANCKADFRLVNGEWRIGIFARKALKKGTEILINYGTKFFPG